jgi:hypothetical protein
MSESKPVSIDQGKYHLIPAWWDHCQWPRRWLESNQSTKREAWFQRGEVQTRFYLAFGWTDDFELSCRYVRREAQVSWIVIESALASQLKIVRSTKGLTWWRTIGLHEERVGRANIRPWLAKSNTTRTGFWTRHLATKHLRNRSILPIRVRKTGHCFWEKQK